MKVLVLTVFAIPHVGGASTHIESLLRVLEEHDVLLRLVHGGRLASSIGEHVAFCARRLVGRDRARIYRLERTLSRMRDAILDCGRATSELIVHCHDPLATCAALRASVPHAAVVQTVHGPWSREIGTMGGGLGGRFAAGLRELEAEAFSGAHLLLPVDRGQAEILETDFRVESSRMRIIENAVDVDDLADLGIGPSPPGLPERFFLVPRRLVPKNGVEFALRALAQLDRFDLSIVVAGDGPLLPDLKALAAGLGIASRTFFPGSVPRPQLLRILKRAEAVVVPSVPANGVVEATSLSVLEGMACGVPVIGSAIGGIVEILVDSSHGYLVPPGEPRAIGAAMHSVLSLDRASRASLVERARNRVRARFGLASWAQRILDAYHDARRN